MGNCQAVDAATVVIHHPDGRMEKAYWPLPATQVMVAHPGHYVAVVIPVIRPLPTTSDGGGGGGGAGHPKPARYLKLLRPDDTLLIGHVYRLVSFEEVLKEFTSRRHVRLSRLLLRQEETKPSSRDATSGRSAAAAAGAQREDADGRVAEWEKSPAAVEKSEADEAQLDTELEQVVQSMTTSARSRASGGGRHGQWRPALQSIAEIGGS